MPKSSPYRGVTLFRPTGKWRAQISANGRTTSLGDHDTQEAAAAAFDRAAINKDGHAARTNFNAGNYAAEMTVLTSLSFNEVVAELRARARKGPGHSSHYRGVSLLRATGRWHAQINAAGMQVHLGFFATEAAAARAYDRAALAEAAQMGDTSHVQTNFDRLLYRDEVAELQRMTSSQLVAALAMDPLASADPEASVSSPRDSGGGSDGSAGHIAGDAGWFEGRGGWLGDSVAAPSALTKERGRPGSAIGGDGGGSNTSSVEVLPHHCGDMLAGYGEAASRGSPPRQQEAAAAPAGGGPGYVNLTLELRLPPPDSLQAQLRQLHHLPSLPPRLRSPSAAGPKAEQQQQQQQQRQQRQWQPFVHMETSPPGLPQLRGSPAAGGAATWLPPDSWLSPGRVSGAAVYSGNSGKPASSPRQADAARTPVSPTAESPSWPHRDAPDATEPLQRAARRRASRKLDGEVYDTSGTLPPPQRTAVAGSKRARLAAVPAAVAAEALSVQVPATAAPPRNRRKGNPVRAVLG